MCGWYDVEIAIDIDRDIGSDVDIADENNEKAFALHSFDWLVNNIVEQRVTVGSFVVNSKTLLEK